MLKQLASCLVIVIALASCAGSRLALDNVDKIKVGMTEAQVLELMGEPTMTTTADQEQIWSWGYANLAMGKSYGASVVFVKGQVKELPSRTVMHLR